MSAAALDRLLALLVAAQLATGLLSLRAGSPPTAPLFVAHGLLGGALLVAVAWKLRRSLGPAIRGRRWGRLALGTLLAALTLAALGGGIAWVASGRILEVGPWTVLTLHALAALALVPVAILHLLPRRWRLVRAPASRGGRLLSRRTALATLGIGALGALAWAATNLSDALAGGMRRFTGSRWLPDGGIPPPTTFFGEGAEPIDPTAWRLRVHGAVERPVELSLEDLTALGADEEAGAVLDCTGGWALRTTWRGARMGRVLDVASPTPGARLVTIRSVTGWYARMPLDEARSSLLATSVAGQPLPHGNGAPCRLVAPDRRGLEWVKWVTDVEVS
jgi:DMSO/TMAO reductase YedYZ molybdopterin-dependent catalytic subunit